MNLIIDPSVVERLNHLRSKKNQDSLMLRITVDSGGCSGFQYQMVLTEDRKPDDLVFEEIVLTDQLSLSLMNNATVRFETSLAGSDFVIDNPNAVSGCGCGTSFAV